MKWWIRELGNTLVVAVSWFAQFWSHLLLCRDCSKVTSCPFGGMSQCLPVIFAVWNSETIISGGVGDVSAFFTLWMQARKAGRATFGGGRLQGSSSGQSNLSRLTKSWHYWRMIAYILCHLSYALMPGWLHCRRKLKNFWTRHAVSFPRRADRSASTWSTLTSTSSCHCLSSRRLPLSSAKLWASVQTVSLDSLHTGGVFVQTGASCQVLASRKVPRVAKR